jgi:hypothetical protein
MGYEPRSFALALVALVTGLLVSTDGVARVPAVCDPATRESVVAAFQQSPSAVAVVVGPGMGVSASSVALYPRPARQQPVVMAWASLSLPQAVTVQEGLFYQLQTSAGPLWVRMSEVEAVARPTTGRRPSQGKQKEGYGIRALGGPACNQR